MRNVLQNLLASFRYGWARRFVEDKDASATVEVALTAPIAFAFLSCLTVLSEGMEVLGKVNLTASTIDNIVSSQSSPLAGSSLNCILGAAAPVMAPWDASPMTVVVSEVQVDTNAGQTATVV